VAEMFPLLLLAALFVAMVVFSRRKQQRVAAADAARRERVTTGTDVMTTSGLYGTVVAVNDDGTVLLSIAPGVEVRWTIAALREVDELPEQYREPIAGELPQQSGQVQQPGKSLQAPSGTDAPAAESPSSTPQRAVGPSSRRPRRRGAGPG
jgi:preprotein translocase subunit YajC